MMETLKAGLIGCGGRGRAHAVGYYRSNKVDLVACADPKEDAAAELAEEFGVPRTYSSYEEMLAAEDLDVVGMALWTGLHCEAILACVDADNPPRMINAEKPMALTYGDSRRMHQACEAAGIMLTFSHQRRFAPSFSRAKDLLDAGAIGELNRLESYCPNLFDWGTHWFDMMLFYNDNRPVEWVMGQIDATDARTVFGALVDTYGLSYFRWENEVTGLLATGEGHGGTCANRMIGTNGIIEVHHDAVRLLREGKRWEEVELEECEVPGGATTLYLLDAIECLLEGRKSILDSENALQATELIFATYESSRRRGRIHLPLEAEDSALISMVEGGQIPWEEGEKSE